jgi:Flp pilus assembly protein TadG
MKGLNGESGQLAADAGVVLRKKRMAQTAAGGAAVAGASKLGFDRFLRRSLSSQGQALIEYILVLPMVFLLMVNVINFGGFFYAFITVANAARAGADYAIMGGASVASGHISLASASQITAVITTEIASLPNNPSLSVNICQNNNTTFTTLAGSCSSFKSDPNSTDPEPTNYVVTGIDVTYTYVPFIPLFSFPNLNIHATLPTTTIHRRAVMRSLQ